MINYNRYSISKLTIHRIKLLVLTSLILSASGCALFKSTQRPDLSPYAENIIKITGDIQYGLSQSQAIYLREYLEGPKVKNLDEYQDKVRGVMRSIIAYSIEVVTLGNTKMKDRERSQKLADYLDRLLRPVLQKPDSKLDFTDAELDTVLINVRKQKNFLDALNATQPLLDNIAATIGRFLDETKNVLDEALEEIHDRIMDDSRIMVVGIRNLRDNQFKTMSNVEYLQKYRLGDSSALDSLFSKEPSLKEVVKDQSNITPADLRAMEERLLFKLKVIYDIREQLSVDIDLYNKQLRELDETTKIYNEALRKVRVVVIVWSEAHRKLAAGVTDPAKIDLVGMVVNAASSVIK
jgi:hypothetical protein